MIKLFGYKIPTEYLPKAIDVLPGPAKCSLGNTGFHPQIPISPNLKRINFAGFSPSQTTYLDKFNMTFCLLKNSIKSLDFSQLTLFQSPSISRILGVYGLNLSELYLEKMGFDVDLARISYFSSNLEKIYISKNTFTFTANQSLCEILPNLKYLDISFLKIDDVPSHIFRKCKVLKFINMSHSGLIYIDKEMTKHFDEIQAQTRNLTLDLTDNLFHCHCHEKHTSTIHWLRHTDVTIVNMEQLQCIGANDKELIHSKDLQRLRQAVFGRRRSCHDYLVHTRRCPCNLSHNEGLPQATRHHNVHLQAATVAQTQQRTVRFRRLLVLRSRRWRNHGEDTVFPGGGMSLEMLHSPAQLPLQYLLFGRRFAPCTAQCEHARLAQWGSPPQRRAPYLERSLARHVELHRSFTHRVMYVALEELCDVTEALDDDVTLVLKSGKLLKWKPGGDERDEAEFMTRLLKRVCGKLQWLFSDGLLVDRG